MQTFRRMGGARGNQTAACYNRSQLNSVCRRKPASIPSWGEARAIWRRATNGSICRIFDPMFPAIRPLSPILASKIARETRSRPVGRVKILSLSSCILEGVNKIGQANLERNLSGGVKSVFASSLRSVSLEEKSNSRDKRSQWAPTDK